MKEKYKLEGYKWVSPPGESIEDIMHEEGKTLLEVSKGLGISADKLKLLLRGFIPIDEKMAYRLSEVIGSTKEFWMKREAEYRRSIHKI